MRKQLLCIFFFAVVAGSAFAQTQPEVQKMHIDLNTGFSIANDNSFTNVWDPTPAIHLNLRVPFYAGNIEGGVRFMRFEGFAPTETDSDFSSVYMYIGYSYPLEITSWYNITPLLRFGNNLMVFDESETYINYAGTEKFVTDKNESEFAYELVLRNQFQITGHWYLNVELSYNHTYTYYPLPVALFTAGISYSFSQPDWFKDIIQ